MKLGLGMSELSDGRLRYAKQIGADGIFFSLQGLPGYAARGYATTGELAALKAQVESYGLEVLALRADPHRTAAVLAGQPERDEEIEHLGATIRAAGQAGISTLFFNLTPWRSWRTPWPQQRGIPPLRPSDVRHGSGPGRYYQPVGRGGAVLLRHDSARAAEDSARAPADQVAPLGHVTASELWERLRYLYERIIPVAEEASVNVGAHPDDPPERIYRGVEQVLNTVEGLQRLVDLVPSPRSGLLLCLGTLHEMGHGPDETMAAIERFLQQGKIFSAHFRNPRGTVPNGGYQEDFLDEGDLDMLAVMRLLHRYRYQGSLDPDHAVGIVGDEGGRIAFAWELAYMKALKRAVEAGV